MKRYCNITLRQRKSNGLVFGILYKMFQKQQLQKTWTGTFLWFCYEVYFHGRNTQRATSVNTSKTERPAAHTLWLEVFTWMCCPLCDQWNVLGTGKSRPWLAGCCRSDVAVPVRAWRLWSMNPVRLASLPFPIFVAEEAIMNDFMKHSERNSVYS